MEISPLEECFDKHNFEELNNIDTSMLSNAVMFYQNNFTNENGAFFDVGSNAGSFIKVLQMQTLHQISIVLNHIPC
jgi:hypothetical protein